MAKQGLELLDDYEPYHHDGKVFLRVRHDDISEAHRQFDQCMHDALTGRHYGSLAEVEQAFGQASETCHKTHPY